LRAQYVVLRASLWLASNADGTTTTTPKIQLNKNGQKHYPADQRLQSSYGCQNETVYKSK
jgi:hypothetical protein